jgi:hypothetical protein
MSCGGNWPCDEKCGFLCWYRRIRAGYCGHGCDWYRERVSFYGSGDRFTPYVSSANGYASQFNNDSGGYAGGWDPGYSQGSSNGYGSSSYSQGGGERPSDYPQDQQAQDRGYDPSASAPRRERIVDRIRRYFSITPRQERRESSTVHFERPLNGEAVPLKRFNGPKYPPDCSGRNC